MRRAGAALGLGLMVAGCASSGGPEAAARAYGDAVAARRADRIRAASDAPVQELLSEAEVERFLTKNDATAERAARALAQSPVWAMLRYPDGSEVVLQREDGGWKVTTSPLPLPRQDTPEQAVQTFLFAARGHLEVLRRLLPEEVQERYASDAALARRLTALQPRIQALREGFTAMNVARVEGDEATIAYGEGRRVRLIRQKERWRILDLE